MNYVNDNLNSFRTFGNSGVARDKFQTGTEEEFIRLYEGREGYTGLYSFYNLPTGSVKRDADFLKRVRISF